MSTLKAPERGESWLERTGSVASSVGAVLGLIFLPKCPLCIAAYLASFGVGAGAAAFAAPLLRPLAVVLALMAFAALLRSAWRSVAREPTTSPGCCARLVQPK